MLFVFLFSGVCTGGKRLSPEVAGCGGRRVPGHPPKAGAGRPGGLEIRDHKGRAGPAERAANRPGPSHQRPLLSNAKAADHGGSEAPRHCCGPFRKADKLAAPASQEWPWHGQCSLRARARSARSPSNRITRFFGNLPSRLGALLGFCKLPNPPRRSLQPKQVFNLPTKKPKPLKAAGAQIFTWTRGKNKISRKGVRRSTSALCRKLFLLLGKREVGEGRRLEKRNKKRKKKGKKCFLGVGKAMK